MQTLGGDNGFNFTSCGRRHFYCLCNLHTCLPPHAPHHTLLPQHRYHTHRHGTPTPRAYLPLIDIPSTALPPMTVTAIPHTAPPHAQHLRAALPSPQQPAFPRQLPPPSSRRAQLYRCALVIPRSAQDGQAGHHGHGAISRTATACWTGDVALVCVCWIWVVLVRVSRSYYVPP